MIPAFTLATVAMHNHSFCTYTRKAMGPTRLGGFPKAVTLVN